MFPKIVFFFKSQIIHGFFEGFPMIFTIHFGGPVSPSLRNTHLLVFSFIFCKKKIRWSRCFDFEMTVELRVWYRHAGNTSLCCQSQRLYKLIPAMMALPTMRNYSQVGSTDSYQVQKQGYLRLSSKFPIFSVDGLGWTWGGRFSSYCLVAWLAGNLFCSIWKYTK